MTMAGIFPGSPILSEGRESKKLLLHVFFVNNVTSRSSLPLSLRESVSIPISHSLEKKMKRNDVKVHKSRTFFTSGISDFAKLYIVEFIFFSFFLKMTLETTTFFYFEPIEID